jgi:hypothetical protein
MPSGWTKQGPFEAKYMIDELLLKVEDDSDYEDESKIFKSPPTSLLTTTSVMM